MISASAGKPIKRKTSAAADAAPSAQDPIIALTAMVIAGFKTTTETLNRLERQIEINAVASVEDLIDIEDQIAALGGDLSTLHNDLSHTERRLGAIERTLDTINRRTESDVQDLLKRVSVLEAAIKH